MPHIIHADLQKMVQDTKEMSHLDLQIYLDKQVSIPEQDWAHYHVSLISADSYHQGTSEGQVIAKENGWSRRVFLNIHRRILLEAYLVAASKQVQNQKLLALFAQELQLVNGMEELVRINKDSDRTVCLSDKVAALPNSKRVRFIGGWSSKPGSSGHAIYFDLIRQGDDILVIASNLGGGIIGNHPISQSGYKIEPVALKFKRDSKELNRFLNDIVVASSSTDSDKALELIYKRNVSFRLNGLSLLRELRQETGNCVVKNCFFAMRLHCNDDDLYRELFKEIYTTVARNMIRVNPINLLPSKESLSYALHRTQMAFKDRGFAERFVNEVAGLKSAVQSQQVQRVMPMPAQQEPAFDPTKMMALLAAAGVPAYMVYANWDIIKKHPWFVTSLVTIGGTVGGGMTSNLESSIGKGACLGAICNFTVGLGIFSMLKKWREKNAKEGQESNDQMDMAISHMIAACSTGFISYLYNSSQMQSALETSSAVAKPSASSSKMGVFYYADQSPRLTPVRPLYKRS